MKEKLCWHGSAQLAPVPVVLAGCGDGSCRNPYNLITFQTSAYTEVAELEITPAPDSILRVFMVFRALDEPMEIESPDLAPFAREGFTVVEWGGRQEK